VRWNKADSTALRVSDKAPLAWRMLINACRPFTWRDQFPKSNVFSSEERKLVEAKYHELFESAATRPPASSGRP
jgi:hypothetical protein